MEVVLEVCIHVCILCVCVNVFANVNVTEYVYVYVIPVVLVLRRNYVVTVRPGADVCPRVQRH